ncbi:uncharacterized protein N7500_010583 [Penicillium coprophilum]|uniref:uncharacterized protein n=1 Tax=Penicillium coprophilum TaxID=36646 RepID=UPI0023A6BAF4|nr:uncharacterized protein N7500_010583 [Penicillium coprophilum]KAJ5150394.1 hypothetical protein N7500_010583 [Penicillium coprophilum]
MSSQDSQLPLQKKIVTALDLADLVTRGTRANTTLSDTTISDLTSTLEQDTEDRQELEAAVHDRALASLASQGLGGITKEQLESQKAIGMLLCGVERLLKFKDERAEHYLDRYLRGLSFMNGLIFSH